LVLKYDPATGHRFYFHRQKKRNAMKRTYLVFGTILGLLLCIPMFYTVHLCYTSPGFESNDLLGYVVYVVIFSLVFVGTWNYRNKHLGGFITFGKAFKTGLLIALAGSTLYVVVWLFYYYLFVPDFLEVFTAHIMMTTPPEKLETTTKILDIYRWAFKNPFTIALATYLEVFPIGFIVALFSALVLKRKPRKDETIPLA
jgi:hypothetical protein